MLKLGDKPKYKIIHATQAMLSTEQIFHTKKLHVIKNEKRKTKYKTEHANIWD